MKADSEEVVWPKPSAEMVAGLGLKYSNVLCCTALPLSGAC